MGFINLKPEITNCHIVLNPVNDGHTITIAYSREIHKLALDQRDLRRLQRQLVKVAITTEILCPRIKLVLVFPQTVIFYV